jgi:hypothetical protein
MKIIALLLTALLLMSFSIKRVDTKNQNSGLETLTSNLKNIKLQKGSISVSFGVLKCFFDNGFFTSKIVQGQDMQDKFNEIITKY